MKLRIPYLLAAVLATASLFYLADSKGLSAAPLVSLTTGSGHTVHLADASGKTRLITFWSPDCPISERNVPALSQLQEQFADEEFEVIAVAMPYSTESAIESYKRLNQVDFPIAYDQNGDVSNAFPGVRFTPTTFLIDSAGNIVWRHIGRMTATQGAQQINEVLQPRQLAQR